MGGRAAATSATGSLLFQEHMVTLLPLYTQCNTALSDKSRGNLQFEANMFIRCLFLHINVRIREQMTTCILHGSDGWAHW